MEKEIEDKTKCIFTNCKNKRWNKFSVYCKMHYEVVYGSCD